MAKRPRICGLFRDFGWLKQRERTGWLTWQESNCDIPFSNFPFEIWALFGANSPISRGRDWDHVGAAILLQTTRSYAVWHHSA